MRSRCFGGNKLYDEYHDEVWGEYNGDNFSLFRALVLETQHSGLSYLLVLKKELNYRELFYNFNMQKIANMSDDELEIILKNPKIIRNRAKIYSIRANAVVCIDIIKEFGSLDTYFRGFIANFRAKTTYNSRKDVPTQNSESLAISKDMKKRGAKFVGAVTIYSLLEATGYYNNHLVTCFKY